MVRGTGKVCRLPDPWCARRTTPCGPCWLPTPLASVGNRGASWLARAQAPSHLAHGAGGARPRQGSPAGQHRVSVHVTQVTIPVSCPQLATNRLQPNTRRFFACPSVPRGLLARQLAVCGCVYKSGSLWLCVSVCLRVCLWACLRFSLPDPSPCASACVCQRVHSHPAWAGGENVRVLRRTCVNGVQPVVSPSGRALQLPRLFFAGAVGH